VVKVNGLAVKSPSEMRLKRRSVTGSVEKNILGDAVMDFLGVKRVLSLGWATMSPSELETLFDEVEKGFVTVSFPGTGGEETEMVAYASDRSAGVLMVKNGVPVWTDVEMELQER